MGVEHIYTSKHAWILAECQKRILDPVYEHMHLYKISGIIIYFNTYNPKLKICLGDTHHSCQES